MTFLLAAPVLIFITSIALGMVLPGKRNIQFCIASLGSLMGIFASAVIFSEVLSHGIISINIGSWKFPFGITLVADRFSALMSLVGNILGFIIIIYSHFDTEDIQVRHGFYPLAMALLAGANGVLLTGDLFNLYVWFEVLLVSAFGLLTLGNTRRQLKGALPYVFINLFASTLLLISVGSLYGLSGSLNMAELSVQLTSMEMSNIQLTVSILFFLSLGIKSALVPFYFWLPLTYPTTSTSTTALFSAFLTKVAVYALIRIFTLFFSQEMLELQNILFVCASLTMIIGVLAAAGQSDFKRILSFHIISQIGYMLMGLSFFTAYALAGATFFIIHNMLIKTTLFLISGVSEKYFGSTSLSDQGGLFHSHPKLSFFFLLSAFSLAGLPPLSGFWGKLLLAQSGLRAGHYVVVGVSLGVSLLTLFSMTKIWKESFWGPPQIYNQDKKAMAYPVYLLALLSFTPALFPGPILEYFIHVGQELMNPDSYIEAVRLLGGQN